MAGKKGKAIFFFLLFLLPVFGFAKDFALSIEPKDFNGVPEIYKDELVSYQIKAINFGSEKITGLHIELNAEPGLAIMDNAAENENNVEKQAKTIEIEQIKPGEIAVVEFLLKAKADKSEKAIVSANYGLQNYTNSVVAFLKIVPSNVVVSANPKHTSFAPTEENALLLAISNNSAKPISAVQASLVLPRDFESDANSFFLAELASKQKTENNEFAFRAKELAQGKRRIALLVSFTDEKGKHTLDKAVNLEVKSSSLAILAVFIAIAFIAGIVLLFGKNGSEKKAVEKKAEKPKNAEQKKTEAQP